VIGPKQAVVLREYRPTPDACAQALALLLRKPIRKKAAPASRPDDPERRSDEIRAKDSIP
jgi:hypothetical protein